MRIPPGARRLLRPIAAAASSQGVKAYAVGGCVRDWTLGRTSRDLDLSVEGDPAPLAEVCARLLGAPAQAFGQFGTLRVVGRAYRIDLARSRAEEYPQPAALPVVRPAPIEKDLFRRDFTINAMAAALEPGERLIDPHGGAADLEAGRLRLLHDASFRDDPTRVFRAARFLARFGFRPAPRLEALAAEALRAGHAARLSRHRVAQEFWKILGEAEAERPLRILESWGYLELVFPGLRWPRLSLKAPEERLGLIAAGAGDGFLKGLPLERSASAAAFESLELLRRKAAPKAAPSAQAARVVRALRPRLPKAALLPAFLTGADLQKLGIEPGMKYGELLTAAARAQWSGALKTRAQALRWLRDRD